MRILGSINQSTSNEVGQAIITLIRKLSNGALTIDIAASLVRDLFFS